MYRLLVLISLSFNLFSCYADDIYWKPNDGYGQPYIGNPDRFSKIVRPCPVYDLNCIRKFFSSHAHCEESRGPLPDSLYRSQYDAHLSFGNYTTAFTNEITTGFNNTRIEEFYLNYATDQVVFTIELRNLGLLTRNAYFLFYRRGREPIVRNTTVTVFFDSLSITAVIPKIYDLQFNKMEVTAFLPAAISPFTVGPELFVTTEPDVNSAVLEMFLDLPTSYQEFQLLGSQVYPPAYIQYNICDFGYEPVRKSRQRGNQLGNLGNVSA